MHHNLPTFQKALVYLRDNCYVRISVSLLLAVTKKTWLKVGLNINNFSTARRRKSGDWLIHQFGNINKDPSSCVPFCSACLRKHFLHSFKVAAAAPGVTYTTNNTLAKRQLFLCTSLVSTQKKSFSTILFPILLLKFCRSRLSQMSLLTLIIGNR